MLITASLTRQDVRGCVGIWRRFQRMSDGKLQDAKEKYDRKMFKLSAAMWQCRGGSVQASVGQTGLTAA
jgi:hypothetical protein